MKLLPVVIVLLVAACAPGPQPPTPLEPVAPLAEPLPEEPLPAEPLPTEPLPAESLPEVPLPEEPPVVVVPDAPATSEPADALAAPTTPAEPAAPAGEEGEAGEEAAPTSAPQGSIGISADNETFVTSSADELNPVTVAAGGTFYLQFEASDPDGIAAIAAELRNSADAGTLPTGPFSVASSDCDAQLASAPTEVTCTVAVTIAPGTQNIREPGESAYAFRPNITDTLGNNALAFSWAYLIVEP